MRLNEITGYLDTNPIVKEYTWDEWLIRLTQVRYTQCGADCTGKKCPHKYGPAFIPALFSKPGVREKRFVTEVTALVFDLDDKSDEEIKECAARLAHLSHVWYASHSDSEDLSKTGKHPKTGAPLSGPRRFRVIVQLKEPCPKRLWDQLRDKAASVFGIEYDEGAKDCSRLFYFPSRPLGASYDYHANPGEPLDVAKFLGLPDLSAGSNSTPNPSGDSTGAHVPRSSAAPDGSTLDYGEFIDRLKALQKRKAREPYLLSQEHARLLEQALKGESLVTEQTTSRDTALVKVIGIVLTNLGPQWAPALEVLLQKSCAAMGMDDDTTSFLDLLPYKIERGRDNAREHYEERQKALIEACEAVARYGEHTEESSSDPVINAFNKRFFIGWNGGLSECVYWHDTAQGIKPVTESSIRLATNHMSHKNEKDKVIKTFDYWRVHPEARRYERVYFNPMREVAHNEYNLFRGYNVKPQEGDWSLFREFIWDVICSRDEKLYVYLLTWLATMFQTPYKKPGTAIVLYTEKHGLGKGFFAHHLGHILGRELYVSDADPESVFGKFNGHLEMSILINIDESKGQATDRSLMDKVKNAITEPKRMIEHKGLKRYDAPNYSWFLYTTNNKDVVHIDANDRRFVVIEPNESWKGSYHKFNEVEAQLKDGGYEAFLFDLLNYDLRESQIELRTIPKTAAREAMKLDALPTLALFWQEYLQDSSLTEISFGPLYQEYQATKPRYLQNMHKFVKDIRAMAPKGLGSNVRTMISGERIYKAKIDIATARQEFDEKFGVETQWEPLLGVKASETEEGEGW